MQKTHLAFYEAAGLGHFSQTSLLPALARLAIFPQGERVVCKSSPLGEGNRAQRGGGAVGALILPCFSDYLRQFSTFRLVSRYAKSHTKVSPYAWVSDTYSAACEATNQYARR